MSAQTIEIYASVTPLRPLAPAPAPVKRIISPQGGGGFVNTATFVSKQIIKDPTDDENSIFLKYFHVS